MNMPCRKFACGLAATAFTAASFALSLPPSTAQAQTAPGVTYTPIYTFGAPPDAGDPDGALTIGSNGAFYGPSGNGGTDNGGTVYRITPSGAEQVLDSFSSYMNLYPPEGPLALGPDGNLYGSTGGDFSDATTFGMLFELTPTGNITSLYNFVSSTTGGPPFFGRDGRLYGENVVEGADAFLFTLTSEGMINPFFTFTPSIDGPQGDGGANMPLTVGPNGDYYGTTYFGGQGAINLGSGTVFRISPSGDYKLLHAFDPPDASKSSTNPDGEHPDAGVAVAKDGTVYGTAEFGGYVGNGTIFKIAPDGKFFVLHEFRKDTLDGTLSNTKLTLGTDGNLYGVAGGGLNGTGTIFQITPSGAFTTLYSCAPTTNYYYNQAGASPSGSLLENKDGILYGVMGTGGVSGKGVVFSLNVPSLTGISPVKIASLTITPTTLTGNSERVTGTVTLDQPAPVGGALVRLISSTPLVAKVGGSVVVPVGSLSASFNIQTAAVVALASVTITAAYNSTTASGQLTVTPMPSTPTLADVVLSPATRLGDLDNGDLDFVYLTGNALSNMDVTVTSSDPSEAHIVGTPAVVRAGFTRYFFHIVTSNPETTDKVTITATVNGVSKSAHLTVNPAPNDVKYFKLDPQAGKAGTTTTDNRIYLNGSVKQDTKVTLTSSEPKILDVPKYIMVAAGSDSHRFTIKTEQLPFFEYPTITATTPDGASQSINVTVGP